MRTAYFDCFSGAAGDMCVAAMIDAGASLQNLKTQLGTLEISGFDITAEKIRKQGFAATQFTVRTNENQPHRHLGDVVSLIRSGRLSSTACDRACLIFERLAEAEAAVHGTSVDKVHFHEVGAIDAIVDIVGSCLALEELQVERIWCSAIAPGSGTVDCAHGTLPVPAPATAQLLKGIPLAVSQQAGELTTPTGAAILTTLADGFGSIPAMTVSQLGYGAGQREGSHSPNLLRVVIGEDSTPSEITHITVLQANIDDQSPEIISYAQELLIEKGALDAFCEPIYMKKGRIGVLLTVLCTAERTPELEAIILRETTTLGVRRQTMQRTTLQRHHETVNLEDGPVRIKVGTRAGEVLTAAPEFEDCKAIAGRSGDPVKDIMSQAMQVWRQQPPGHG